LKVGSEPGKQEIVSILIGEQADIFYAGIEQGDDLEGLVATTTLPDGRIVVGPSMKKIGIEDIKQGDLISIECQLTEDWSLEGYYAIVSSAQG